MRTLSALSARLPLIFPVRPRTRALLATLPPGATTAPGLRLIDPLGYVDFLQLEDAPAVVITDSGGVQEEAHALGVLCLTVRDNTERPVTITHGTNKLVGSDPTVLPAAVDVKLAGKGPRRRPPRALGRPRWQTRSGRDP